MMKITSLVAATLLLGSSVSQGEGIAAPLTCVTADKNYTELDGGVTIQYLVALDDKGNAVLMTEILGKVVKFTGRVAADNKIWLSNTERYIKAYILIDLETMHKVSHFVTTDNSMNETTYEQCD